MKGLGFGTKLAIAFLVIAIFPMTVVVYYNLAQGRQELLKCAQIELATTSRATAHSIAQVLLENQRNSATLAGDPLSIRFLSLSDPDRKALEPLMDQYLENFIDHHPDCNSPGLMDAAGIVKASLDKVLMGADRSFRDFFQAAVQGRPFVSDILLGRSTGKPGVFLSNPVKTKQGEILGISIVWLKADTLRHIIDQVNEDRAGTGYLINRDGVIIAHPDPDRLYRSLGELSPDAVSDISSSVRFGTVPGTDQPYLPASLGMDELASHIRASRKPGSFRYFSSMDHQYHVAGYFPLKEPSWTVVVDLPESRFLAPLNRLETMAHVSIGLVILISLGISLLLSRSISRPIRNLTAAAAGIQSDMTFDPQTIADITSGKDEIAYLGQAFSSMVQALQKSEEKYRILVENGADLFYRTDREGRLTFVSSSVYRLSGYAVDEVMGMKITEALYVNPEERGPFLSRLEQTGSVNDFEVRLKRKDGSIWWASANSHVYKDKDGKILGVEGVVRDITERREKEEAQRERKAAQAANYAKSEFLATMSHEIRTPLNVVLGFSEMLSADLNDPRQKSYVEAMKAAGKSLLTLINDILDLSKIEAGKMVFNYGSVSLKTLFAEIETIFRMKIFDKGLGFEVDVADDLPDRLMLDEIRIRQILLNLVGNAAKFTEKGMIKLTARKQAGQNRDRIGLIIKVEDTGPGIEEKELCSIFESFKQVDGKTNRKHGGAGLGLSICKKLTEAMNGQIHVTSTPGSGTTFVVGLKEVVIPPDAVMEKPMEDPADKRLPAWSEKKKVLIVDDIESNRFMIRELLTLLNQEVLEAQNGLEALVMVKENSPDIIIMDNRMPVLDGDQATKILKSDPHTQKIPVISFTGDVVTKTKAGGLNKGYDGYLTKPIKIQDLTDELSKWMG